MAGGIHHQAERNVAHGCEHELFEFVIVDFIHLQGFTWLWGNDETIRLTSQSVSEEFEVLLRESSGRSYDPELPAPVCGYVESGFEQLALLLQRSSRLATI